MTVCQKLDAILESKVVQKLNLEKRNVFYKLREKDIVSKTKGCTKFSSSNRIFELTIPLTIVKATYFLGLL